MLDDSSLDARLAAIRRQSSLDARAALFVLSPVSASELVEFINSLLSALVPPALEYYTNHSKRVRRKRTALPTSNVYFASTLGHLPPIGWNIRYEFKQGCFAEFRGEKEVALKHYLQAIFLISEYIGATTVPGSWIVPPRTKRWAEAKLLADCISIKVLAHHLSPPFAPRLTMTHFNTHLAVFSKLSRSWGMSDKGWELWSWKARQ
jgi:trafficking protein particle complex subunit 11